MDNTPFANVVADMFCDYIHKCYLEHFEPIIKRAQAYDELAVAANKLVDATDVPRGHTHPPGYKGECDICNARMHVCDILIQNLTQHS